MINHPLLASRLLTMIVGEAIFDTHPTPGDATAEVSYEVVADQIGKIKRSNVFFDPMGIDGAAISDIGSLLQILSSNQFYPLDIKSVNVKVRILGKRNTATIDRIFVKKSEYEPGETVDVGVVLRPYKQDRVTKTFSVKIPATAPDGKLMLAVRGGSSPAMMQMLASVPGDEDGGAPSSPPPAIVSGGSAMANADNVKQLVDKYLEREKNNEVVVQLMMRSTAMNVAGEKLAGLPSAIADVMKSSRNSGLKMEREEVKQTFPQDVIVFGAAQLAIDVKRKDLKEQKSPPKLSAPTMDIGGGGRLGGRLRCRSTWTQSYDYSTGFGRGPRSADDDPRRSRSHDAGAKRRMTTAAKAFETPAKAEPGKKPDKPGESAKPG